MFYSSGAFLYWKGIIDARHICYMVLLIISIPLASDMYHQQLLEFGLADGIFKLFSWMTLHWRHNGHGSISNHQPHDCLLNRLFRRRSKKTSKLRVTGLCAGNSPETGEFPAQRTSNAENVSIWWRHHEKGCILFASNFTTNCPLIISQRCVR